MPGIFDAPALQRLDLIGAPVCRTPLYRQYVIAHCSETLHTLDAKYASASHSRLRERERELTGWHLVIGRARPVTDDERQQAYVAFPAAREKHGARRAAGTGASSSSGASSSFPEDMFSFGAAAGTAGSGAGATGAAAASGSKAALHDGAKGAAGHTGAASSSGSSSASKASGSSAAGGGGASSGSHSHGHAHGHASNSTGDFGSFLDSVATAAEPLPAAPASGAADLLHDLLGTASKASVASASSNAASGSGSASGAVAVAKKAPPSRTRGLPAGFNPDEDLFSQLAPAPPSASHGRILPPSSYNSKIDPSLTKPASLPTVAASTDSKSATDATLTAVASTAAAPSSLPGSHSDTHVATLAAAAKGPTAAAPSSTPSTPLVAPAPSLFSTPPPTVKPAAASAASLFGNPVLPATSSAAVAAPISAPPAATATSAPSKKSEFVISDDLFDLGSTSSRSASKSSSRSSSKTSTADDLFASSSNEPSFFDALPTPSPAAAQQSDWLFGGSTADTPSTKSSSPKIVTAPAVTTAPSAGSGDCFSAFVATAAPTSLASDPFATSSPASVDGSTSHDADWLFAAKDSTAPAVAGEPPTKHEVLSNTAQQALDDSEQARLLENTERRHRDEEERRQREQEERTRREEQERLRREEEERLRREQEERLRRQEEERLRREEEERLRRQEEERLRREEQERLRREEEERLRREEQERLRREEQERLRREEEERLRREEEERLRREEEERLRREEEERLRREEEERLRREEEERLRREEEERLRREEEERLRREEEERLRREEEERLRREEEERLRREEEERLRREEEERLRREEEERLRREEEERVRREEAEVSSVHSNELQFALLFLKRLVRQRKAICTGTNASESEALVFLVQTYGKADQYVCLVFESAALVSITTGEASFATSKPPVLSVPSFGPLKLSAMTLVSLLTGELDLARALSSYRALLPLEMNQEEQQRVASTFSECYGRRVCTSARDFAEYLESYAHRYPLRLNSISAFGSAVHPLTHLGISGAFLFDTQSALLPRAIQSLQWFAAIDDLQLQVCTIYSAPFLLVRADTTVAYFCSGGHCVRAAGIRWQRRECYDHVRVH